MKNKILYRTIPLVCIVALVVCMTVTPVSATPINYWDYITATSLSGGDDVCTLDIPTSLWRWVTYDDLAGKTISRRDGARFEYVIFDALQKHPTSGSPDCYQLFMPLHDDAMRIDNIPTGSTFDFVLDMSLKASLEMDFVNVTSMLAVRFYDKEGKMIERQDVPSNDELYIEDGKSGSGKVKYSYELEKPDTAVYCNFHFYHYFSVITPIVSGAYIETVMNSFDMKVSIDSQYRNQSSEMIGDISDKLGGIQDQNNTLIQGTPQQNEQVSGAVGGLEGSSNSLGDLTDQMQLEKPDLSDIDVSVDAIIPDGGMTILSTPILKFWESPTLVSILVLVLTICLVSWVFFGKKG